MAQYQMVMVCTVTQSPAEYSGPILDGDNIATQV